MVQLCKDQHRLPRPLSNPQAYGPDNPFPRAGARASRPMEPKQAMQQWDIDKPKEHAPDVSTRTLSMVLRAVARTTSALPHSKRAAQTKQIVEAAYTRADLPAPFVQHDTAPQPKRTRFEQDVTTALENQVTIRAR